MMIEAESVKGCCAEVIFGPKLSLDQNMSQGIQKVDVKHFNFNLSLFVFLQICSVSTMRSITTWEIKAHVKIGSRMTTAYFSK